MSNSRSIKNRLISLHNEAKKLTYLSATKIKKSFILTPDETFQFAKYISGCVAGAGVFALPSMTNAIYENSLFPDYALKATIIGAVCGMAMIARHRYNQPLIPQSTPIVEEKTPNKRSNFVTLVTLKGNIDDNLKDAFLPLLKKAFEDTESDGIIVRINSHGGSAVQSNIIYDEIMRLKFKHKKRIVAMGEDHLTSYAYMIALSSDAIYVDENTLIGGVGASSLYFNASSMAKKIGLDTHIYSSTKHNSLHPFMPPGKEEVGNIEMMLKDQAKHFIDIFSERRGQYLREKIEVVTSGKCWTGAHAHEIRLVDHIGNLSKVLEKEFKVSCYKEYSLSNPFTFMKRTYDLYQNPSLDSALALIQDKPFLKM